ncbi:molybdopterin-synthase adenylyltransferase MoeB [Vibrio sp. UCD-FRSSP16_10]|uniref:HesA/MoeB/ThiF family protein n=1 Tax=unclassified Vibrio TaxID=2614977 RepID=UPI0008010772|nr:MULTISPECIES: HesA/MoeB/ThiF family protein [unclassified Vibrio]OBT12898.1 molybdopterin-synthase adenylyltransferase MoeB [Vibrio sp. UCD-FRSSP16_30]OBT18361.1 molybdopterin-synthase adenylyltransferase MoeB [Vibrio sp. UCD-FRSSP16_10]
MLSDQEFIRYQRQVMLPEIGEQGQRCLLDSVVLIVGCGGLGSAVALQLAGAGVGKLVLCDDDVVEISNLHRQLSYRESDIGTAKSIALFKQIADLNPMVSVRTVNRRMALDSLLIEVGLADLVIDCSDNFPTRQDINKACLLKKKPLVSGAAIGWDGQLAFFNYQDNTPCYHCLYPFTESSASTKCSESGVMGPNVNMIGSLQSMLAIRALVEPKTLKPGELITFNGRTMTQNKFEFVQDEACDVCRKEMIDG